MPAPSATVPRPARRHVAATTLPALFLALSIAALLALARGQDANWDLLNYHLYNPWAWLTGRYAAGHDLVPAGLQTYHNPLLDVPFYLMVAADWPPRLIAVVLALPAGVAGYFVYRLARLCFGGLEPRLAWIAVAAAVAIGVTGPNARSMLATTMNEWPGTALLAWALLLIALGIDRGGNLRAATLVAAGLLAGAASGLKLTAAGFALAIAVALLVTRGLRRGVLEASVYGVGVIAGVAATLGPWMHEVYRLTGNPLFPYFNSLLPSPLLPPEWSFYKAFGPRTAVQWVTLPFDLLRPPDGYVSEQRYRDARFPVLASLALAALLLPLLWRALRRPAVEPAFAGQPGTRAVLRFGAVYFAVSFALWALLHAIHRYLLALEVLTGIAIVALVIALVRRPRARAVAIVALAALVVFTTRVPSWWRVPYGPSFMAVDLPAIAPGTMVVVVGQPVAYVLTRFPDDARHVGIVTNVTGPDHDSGLRREAARRIAAHSGPLVVLHEHGRDPHAALAKYGLAASNCRDVSSNLQPHSPARLCEAIRR